MAHARRFLLPMPGQTAPTRRTVLAALCAAVIPASSARATARSPLAALEQARGGRLGVFVVDTGTGHTLAHRADERFLMCSTFKLLLAAAVLARVQTGQERLDRRLPYTEADLLPYAPVTRAHLSAGDLTLEGLCQAAVEVSDNTAANLLLATIGGPSAYTRFVRTLGDDITRLDRIEPALNDPAGVFDTTTPRAAAGSVRAALLGDALHPAIRALLHDWMAACTTGRGRLRAGLPGGWDAGDKTGTGGTQTNDLALIRPPGRAPLIVTTYYEGGGENMAAREGVLGQVGTIVAKWAVAQ